MTGKPDATGLTERWAAFASEIRYERLPAQTVEAAKGILLDTLGVVLAATTLGDCTSQVVDLVRANPGRPECSLLGLGDRAPILLAAFCNGSLSHALNFDSLDKAGAHIGLAAVPAPLAAAERRGAVGGKEFLASIAVASEFTSRLGKAVIKGEGGKRFLDGQLLSYFGATAGAGRVLGFSPKRMHDAIGLALMQAAGSRQVSSEGAAAKSVYGGFANHGAIWSVLLAEQGVEARCAALEGASGLYQLFYGGRFDPSALDQKLGGDFFSMADISFKPWAVSSVVRPFVQACLALRQRHGIEPAAIRRIHVRVAEPALAWVEPLGHRRRPQNAATAGNSIPFGIAKALVNGTLTLADFSTAGLSQAEVLALAERIDYSIDGRAENDGRIEMALVNGEVVTAEVSAATHVSSYDELTVKFRDCAAYSAVPIASADLEQSIERIARLEREEDVSALLGLLAPPRRA